MTAVVLPGIALGAACLYVFAAWPGHARADRMKPFMDTLIAHRGLFDNNGDAPENSMAAFKRAVEAGYGIELDVHLTADGQLVVHHDHDLMRSARRRGRIEQMTWRELKDLTLFHSKEHMPLLEDVLSMVGGRVPLIIELKAEHGDDEKELSRRAAKAFDGYEGIFCMESFHPGCLLYFRRNRPHVLRGQLADWQSGIGIFGPMLRGCLFNFLTRPDFIAYNIQYAHRWPYFFLKRILCATTAAWTVKSEGMLREAEKSFDVFIFDSFIPGQLPVEGEEK